jgi:hypothetical protein
MKKFLLYVPLGRTTPGPPNRTVKQRLHKRSCELVPPGEERKSMRVAPPNGPTKYKFLHIFSIETISETLWLYIKN